MSIVSQSPPTRTTNVLVEHVEHFQHRVMQDALADATATFWNHRAELFEWARPRAGDYIGRATEADLRAADQRCKAVAEGCRRRAQWALVQNREAA